MIKLHLLKLTDRTFGRLILKFLPRTDTIQKKPDENIKKILIIRPGGIGDLVLLLPAISALRTKFNESEIHLLCEKRNAGISSLTNDLNKTYLYDKGMDLFRCLANKYDIVIDTEQWYCLSAIVAWFTKAPIRVGFDTNERRILFTHRIPYSHDDYEVYSFFHLIEPLVDKAPQFDENRPFVKIPDKFPFDIIHVPENYLNKIISIFPGASVPERRWEISRFTEVAKEFDKGGYKIVVLGSAKERQGAAKIKEIAADCIDLTAKTSLKDTARVLKASRLLLTADSGLMHLAYAVGIPTISLFGSGIEKKWAPRGKDHIVINKNLDCSPCTKFGYTPRCRKKMQCLSLITTDEVIAAVKDLLADKN